MRVLMKLVGAGFLSAWIAACSTGEDDSGVEEPPSGEEGEKCPADLPAFTTGVANGLIASVRDSGLEVRLIEADHQPPKRDYNTWTVAVLDAASGEPASEAVIAWACAWMPVHDHGSNPKGFESLGDGQFKLVEQNLSMFGPWELRLWVDPTGKEPVYKARGGSTVVNGMACVPSSGVKGAYNAELKFCVPSSIAK